MPRTLNLRKRPGPIPLELRYSSKTENWLSPAVKFTAVTLCRWLEYLADKHEKLKMGENAWDYVLAVVGEEYNTGQELLPTCIPAEWWKEHGFLRSHWELIRASIGTVGDRASNLQAIFTHHYYKLGGAYGVPPAVEETPASRLAPPRDHAPLGHVGVLRTRAMRPIEVPAGRFPIRDFNDIFSRPRW